MFWLDLFGWKIPLGQMVNIKLESLNMRGFVGKKTMLENQSLNTLITLVMF
jgi:hypothetical protein